MQFTQISADQLYIIFRDSNGLEIETTFDTATVAGASLDTNGEILKVQAYAFEEDGEQFTDIDTMQLVMIDDMTGEQSRHVVKDYLEGGVYYDPDHLMGIAK